MPVGRSSRRTRRARTAGVVLASSTRLRRRRRVVIGRWYEAREEGGIGRWYEAIARVARPTLGVETTRRRGDDVEERRT
jgi:hypothetical protein